MAMRGWHRIQTIFGRRDGNKGHLTISQRGSVGKMVMDDVEELKVVQDLWVYGYRKGKVVAIIPVVDVAWAYIDNETAVINDK